jgi:pimeloyl-ACP methyl ester carboxylesterase
MRSIKIRFEGSRGTMLTALLDLPDEGTPKAYAVFAHCFTCTKDYKSIFNIGKVLAQEGWGVMRFDFTGLGESAGSFADTNFSSNVEDLVLASSYLDDNYQAPVMLMGHSLGGAAALKASQRVPSAKALVTIAAPFEPAALMRHFEDRLDEIERAGQARVLVSGRPFTIKKQLIEDLERNRPRDYLPSLRAALLVMHSPQDHVVSVENAERIFAAAPQPKSFVALEGAHHLLLREEDARYAGAIIARWAERYVV